MSNEWESGDNKNADRMQNKANEKAKIMQSLGV